MASIYESNQTMTILGYQYPQNIIGDGGIAREDFINVIKAHAEKGTNDIYDLAIDFFMLGYLYGKRVERHKGNLAEVKPLGIGEMLNENKW